MDLTQAPYARVAPPLPVPRGPVRLSTRPVLNAILLSVAAQGGTGRGLPARFGTWPPSPPGCPAGRNPASLIGSSRLGTAPRSCASSGRPGRSTAPSSKPPRRTGGAKTNAPQSLGRSRGGWTSTMDRGAADDRPELVCSRSPGPAPRSSRGDEGPGERGRPATAPGRGAGGGARGAAAAQPGCALGVCPGAVHAAQ